MHNLTKVWVIGSLATAAVVAITALNAVVALNLSSTERLPLGLRVFLFVAFGLSLAGIVVLSYFTSLYVRNVARQSIALETTIWTILGVGASAAGTTLLIPGIAFVWLVTQQDLPNTVLQQDSMVWIAAWFAVWAVSVVLEIALFTILGLWTKQVLRKRSVGRLDLDFGIRLPQTCEVGINGSRQSLNSRDTTLASPPRTPTSTRVGSSRHSTSATKATAITPRTKLISRGSARSSFDLPFPGTDATTTENAFDRWDTSSVHHEMRVAVGSSPPVTRSGLETIPGSRPDSPADALEGPFLPNSPHATTSDTATTLEWSSSPRGRQLSSPPSSPPNFSRPTSRGNKSISVPFGQTTQDMIHPLFRASSPQPPPIATTGTTVTASPMANDPITPKTLARLRSNSYQKQTPKPVGHWRAMPSIDATSTRPSTAGSRPGSSGFGSPGPSICDDHELPPILPGFVLSAGSRSSLVNYSARKSVKKEKPQSQSSFRL